MVSPSPSNSEVLNLDDNHCGMNEACGQDCGILPTHILYPSPIPRVHKCGASHGNASNHHTSLYTCLFDNAITRVTCAQCLAHAYVGQISMAGT